MNKDKFLAMMLKTVMAVTAMAYPLAMSSATVDVHNESEYMAITMPDSRATKFYNPPIDLKKKYLRVLDIGNSFTDDAVHHLPEILSASGLDLSDMCLYVANRGGASFKSWYDLYNDNDPQTYEIYKVAGGINMNVRGTAAAYNGEQFRNILKDNVWDLIIIHQLSTYSPYYDTWNNGGSEGYLDELLSVIRDNQPQATIGFMLVHSTASRYSANAERSTSVRWNLIAQSAKKMQQDYNMDFIIPYGTAIESLRTTSYNNSFDLTQEGLHLSSGLADYTAACAFYEALFAPRYGVSILGNTARIQSSDTYSVNVTDENAYVAQLCALEAVKDYTKIASLVYPEGISLSSSMDMTVGQSKDLRECVTPANATDRSLMVTTSDANVVSVNADGVITAQSPGTCTITATTYNGISQSCTVTVVKGANTLIFSETPSSADNTVYNNGDDEWVARNIVLTDAQPFYCPHDFTAETLIYKRTYTMDKWQAFYVPFASQYDDWADKAYIAKINDMHQFDNDKDGILETTVVEFVRLRPGDKVLPNVPYVIKPIMKDPTEPEAFAYTFHDKVVTATPATDGYVDCSSTALKYTLTGIYQVKTDMYETGAYALSGGDFRQVPYSGVPLNPFRIYLMITEREGNYSEATVLNAPKCVRVMVDGEMTDIDDIEIDTNTVDEYYDIYGRKVLTPSHGLYIHDGKKVYIK